MPYTIEYDAQTAVVAVIYRDDVPLNDRLRAVEEVCSAYSCQKPLRILVNVRELDMQLTYEEQKYFGQYLANHADLRNARVAVLHRAGTNPNWVVDSFAFMNGYLLAQFDKRSEAELWLKAS